MRSDHPVRSREDDGARRGLRILFYVHRSGRCPARQFLQGLPPEEEARLARSIRYVEEFGTLAGPEYLKRVRATKELWEIRHTGSAYRLLGILAEPGAFVLVHGFEKKRQRIPRREIEVGEANARDYHDRKT